MNTLVHVGENISKLFERIDAFNMIRHFHYMPAPVDFFKRNRCQLFKEHGPYVSSVSPVELVVIARNTQIDDRNELLRPGGNDFCTVQRSYSQKSLTMIGRFFLISAGAFAVKFFFQPRENGMAFPS